MTNDGPKPQIVDITGFDGLALAVIAIAAALFILDFASPFLLPTVCAGIFALILAPVARALSRHLRLPDGLAAVLAVGLTAGTLILTILALAPSLDTWLADSPRWAGQIEQKIAPIKQRLQAVETATSNLTDAAPAAPGTSVAELVLAKGVSIATQAIYIIVLTGSLLAWRADVRRRVILFARRPAARLRLARMVRDIANNVTGYLFVITMSNIGIAIATATILTLLGLPNAIIWGCIFGLSNFVPMIGPALVIISALAVGLATEASLPWGLATAAAMLAVITIEGNIIRPWAMARRIEVNPIAMFVAIAFVVWIWGIGASMIAAPLMVVIYTGAKYARDLAALAVALAPLPKKNGPAKRNQRRPPTFNG